MLCLNNACFPKQKITSFVIFRSKAKWKSNVATRSTTLRTAAWQKEQIINISVQDDTTNNKLSCRRETARRFVSLNILLTHSRSLKSFEMSWVGRVSVHSCISLKLCLYLVPFLIYSSSKNGVTLKLGVGVIQCHWKWPRSIDHTRLSIGRPL